MVDVVDANRVISYHFNNFLAWPSGIFSKLGIVEPLMVIWFHNKFQLDTLYGFFINPHDILDNIFYYSAFNYL